MPTVLITPSAAEDLSDIWLYAAESDLEWADRLLDHFEEKCVLLAEFPEMGRTRQELIEDLRSFTLKNYVIFYRPIPNGIEVLRFLHGARDIPGVFDDMSDLSDEN